MSPDANHLRQGVARFDTGWKPFEIEGVGQADVAGVEDAAVLFVRYDGVREASVDEQLRHRVTTAFKSKVLSKFF